MLAVVPLFVMLFVFFMVQKTFWRKASGGKYFFINLIRNFYSHNDIQHLEELPSFSNAVNHYLIMRVTLVLSPSSPCPIPVSLYFKHVSLSPRRGQRYRQQLDTYSLILIQGRTAVSVTRKEPNTYAFYFTTHHRVVISLTTRHCEVIFFFLGFGEIVIYKSV